MSELSGIACQANKASSCFFLNGLKLKCAPSDFDAVEEIFDFIGAQLIRLSRFEQMAEQFMEERTDETTKN